MQLTIESMMYGPDGLAHDESGKAIFVAGAIEGDVVEASVVEDAKHYSKAVVEGILQPSPNRIEAPCPFVGICGGCPWGSLSREAQLKAKKQNLKSALLRIGKFSQDLIDALVKPILATKDAWGYRNKIELVPTVKNQHFCLGLHGRDPKHIVKVDACPLFEQKFSTAVRGVSGALAYLGNSRSLQLERVGLRASRRTKALEIALWTPTGAFPRAQVARVLNDAAKPTSIVRVMSKDKKQARKVAGVEVLSGEGSWTERIGAESMRLSAPSFFQVNTAAAELLIKLVLDVLAPTSDEVVLDLYCGAGTFTLPLARKSAYVAAVETAGPAVRDLRRNAQIAGLEEVIAVIGGDAVREFPDEEPDVLVVDPPRAGLATEAIELISSTTARDVAYVSCNPATLARDLRRFVDRGVFHPVSATPVDLFPQTFHVETVVHLTR